MFSESGKQKAEQEMGNAEIGFVWLHIIFALLSSVSSEIYFWVTSVCLTRQLDISIKQMTFILQQSL